MSAAFARARSATAVVAEPEYVTVDDLKRLRREMWSRTRRPEDVAAWTPAPGTTYRPCACGQVQIGEHAHICPTPLPVVTLVIPPLMRRG